MKLVIHDNKILCTHADEQIIEGLYPNCTFMIVPSLKYDTKQGDPAPILDAEDTLANVRYQRSLEYPALGDVIDAMFKKEAGDATEWNAIAVSRTEVKARHPKP